MQPLDDELYEDDFVDEADEEELDVYDEDEDEDDEEEDEEAPLAADGTRRHKRWWVRDEDAEKMERYFRENCTPRFDRGDV